MRGARPVVVGMNLDRRIAFGAFERVQLFHLVGVRHELDDHREHGLRSVVQLARHAEEREELHPLHRFLHSSDGFLARDVAALEVALEQRVVRGRDRLDQFVVVVVELILGFGGNVGLLVFAGFHAALVDVRAFGEEVDDAVEVRALPDGNLDRDDFVREPQS